MRPMSYDMLVAHSSRYSINDPRHDDSLADAEQDMLARCLKDPECIQQAMEIAVRDYGDLIADVLANDQCEAGRLLHKYVQKEMEGIAKERLRSEIDSAYVDAMEYCDSYREEW